MRTESALRARARRLGYRVVKSRRDGSFGLIDPYRNAWVLCDRERGHGCTLEEVGDELDSLAGGSVPS